MRRLLAKSLEASFGARWWREPGSQGDPIDLFELLRPELTLVALVLGGSAMLALALGIAAGWGWRAFINRKTSRWWFVCVAVLLAVAAVAVGLLLQGFR